jgi:hypothetical protein
MSIMAIGSDKHLGMVGPRSAVMLGAMNPSSRTSSPQREGEPRVTEKARRGAGPADQMMHAWSMDALRSTVAGSTMVRPKKDECPPEVYLG